MAKYCQYGVKPYSINLNTIWKKNSVVRTKHYNQGPVSQHTAREMWLIVLKKEIIIKL